MAKTPRKTISRRKDKSQWHIVRLFRDFKTLKKRIVADSVTKVLENLRGNSLLDEVESLVQMEQKLPRSYSWKAYPIDHILFWKGIARKIERRRRSHRKARQDTRIVRDIVQRYVNEIKGSFSIPLHRFSNFAGSLLFRILLGRMRYDTQSQARIYSRLKVQGDLAKLRALSDIGSIVYAPTHTSNMDSMLIGHFFHCLECHPQSSVRD